MEAEVAEKASPLQRRGAETMEEAAEAAAAIEGAAAAASRVRSGLIIILPWR